MKGGDQSNTTIYVRGMKQATNSHSRGKKLASRSHTKEKSPTIVSQVVCTHTIKKAMKIGHKPNFPYKICKGYHLTHLCPSIIEVWRMWSQYQGTFFLESPISS